MIPAQGRGDSPKTSSCSLIRYLRFAKAAATNQRHATVRATRWFYAPVCAHSRHHASLIQGACGSHTRLSQYLLRNVPAINIPLPVFLSCFFAERGRFAKQTLKRSDRVCVRNAPRSKHILKRGSGKENLMLTSVSMTVGGVRGCPLRRGGGEQRSANQGDTSPTPFTGCFNMKHDF